MMLFCTFYLTIGLEGERRNPRRYFNAACCKTIKSQTLMNECIPKGLPVYDIHCEVQRVRYDENPLRSFGNKIIDG